MLCAVESVVSSLAAHKTAELSCGRVSCRLSGALRHAGGTVLHRPFAVALQPGAAQAAVSLVRPSPQTNTSLTRQALSMLCMENLILDDGTCL